MTREEILQETDPFKIWQWIRTHPDGKARQANLDMLVEKACAFEATSYQSLFDFIRYIERLKK